jgi:hypothetical protein
MLISRIHLGQVVFARILTDSFAAGEAAPAVSNSRPRLQPNFFRHTLLRIVDELVSPSACDREPR